MPAVATAVPSQGTATATDTAAAQSFGGCLNGQRAGDLMMLIDTSGSLRSTDPQNARVGAANYLLTQLALQSERAGIKLDVQIAGFASVFDRQPTPWTTLGTTTVGNLTQTVNGFASRNDGGDTDYWLALEGARRSLADHAKTAPGESAGTRCQAIAWFTDGKLDIEPRTGDSPDRPTTLPYVSGVDLTTRAGADAATTAAAKSLCRPTGLADALRSAHVVMFAVGLTSPSSPPDSFDLLRSVATGVPYQGGPCGAITNPTPGSFALAANLDGLLNTFDQILGPANVPTPPAAVCAGTDASCRGHEFVLDESVDGLHVLGQALGVPEVTAELVGPDGATHPLSTKTPGAQQPLNFGPVTGSYSWETDASVVIDLADQSHTAAGWAGLWAVRFVDPAATTSGKASTTSIHLWGNILPTWTNKATTAPSGTPLTGVQFGMAKASGEPVLPGDLRGDITLSATLQAPGAAPVVVAKDLTKATIGNPASIDLTSIPPGKADLQLILVLTTASTTRPGTGEPVPGTQLSPQEVDLPLTVEAPVGYPTPSSIDFGTTEGAGGQTAQMDVTGPGCVWVVPGSPLQLTSTPEGVSHVEINADGATTPQTCVDVPQGERRTVTLHMTTDAAGTGTASGMLQVTTAPTGQPDKARVTPVAFTSDFRKPVNVPNFLAALLAALLLGPGIPLALLYLVKWFNARIPDRGLFARRIPVTVTETQVLRGGAPFRFVDGDLNEIVPISAPGARRLTILGVQLRTRVGWSPLGTAYTSVEPGGGLACATSTDPLPHGKQLTGRLPLALHDTWAVFHNPAGPPDAAELLVLLGTNATAAQQEAFAAAIVNDLPGVLDRLRSAIPPDGTTPPDQGPGGHTESSWNPSNQPQYGPPGTVPAGGPQQPGYAGGPPVYGPVDSPTDRRHAAAPTAAPPPPWTTYDSASDTAPNRVPGPTPDGGFSTAYERFYGSGSATADPEADGPTDRVTRPIEPPPDRPPYGQRP